MPTAWGDLLKQIQTATAAGPLPPGVSPFDLVRRKYIQQLHNATGRSVVLYATRWTQGATDPEGVSIVPEDLQGFMEVFQNLPTDKGLDLVLHSPGGSAEAAESIVKYMRVKFSDIRVIVPHAAMSAATMLACAANKIVMGIHSFLGPVDPQFIMQTENGRAAVAAHAILAQFDLAKRECADPSLLPAWIPMLKQYGPALLVQCQLAQELSRSLVTDWVQQYMFAGKDDGHSKATQIAAALADHALFKSHGRFIDRKQARDIGLVVEDLESNPNVEDATLGVFHAATHTFSGTAAVKILENHRGRAFIRIQQQQIIQVGGPMPVAPQPQTPQVPPNVPPKAP